MSTYRYLFRLEAIITVAGVATFRPIATCLDTTYQMVCEPCQRIIKPLAETFFSTSIIAIPGANANSYTDISYLTQMEITRGFNLVIDVRFQDRYNNLVETVPTPGDYTATLTYGT